jgi:DNA-binding NtrC family response regulator
VAGVRACRIAVVSEVGRPWENTSIPALVRHFTHKFAREMQKHIETIPAAAMKALTNWEWPGNVRELENFVERAVIRTRGKSLEMPITELHKSRADSSVTNKNKNYRKMRFLEL